jgi:DNA-binding transcriptional MerR regulator
MAGGGDEHRRIRTSVPPVTEALRFYDGLGLLPPARVDELSGYRHYEEAQLERARLIATLRQAGLPIGTVKELLALDPAELAEQVMTFWRAAETRHAGQRELVAALVARLTGRSTVMYEVKTREMPQRSLLCLKRNVDESAMWAFGKEFIAIMRDRRLPRIGSREGAFFCIFWGQVSADSDGPVELCKPVPDAEAEGLAARCSELTLTRRSGTPTRPCGPGPRRSASTTSSCR